LVATLFFYNWDAAFVLWCCRQAGFDFPEFIVGEPANHWATFALVQTWHDWARVKATGILAEVFFLSRETSFFLIGLTLQPNQSYWHYQKLQCRQQFYRNY
jgi:hypothetical protein